MKRTITKIFLLWLICTMPAAFAGTGFSALPVERMLVKETSLSNFSGTWQEIGTQIGLTYPEYIVEFGRIMGFVLLMAGPGNGWDAESYYRAVENMVPHSIKDHLQGMTAGFAEAMHLSYETAWQLVVTQNFATELLNMNNMDQVPDRPGMQECTGFAVNSPEGTFLCHNTDATPSGDNIVVLMHWKPTGGDYAYMTMDPPGWADVAYGLNEKGIGVTMNAGLPNRDAQIGLPINFMLRYVMEHAATLDEAIGYIESHIDSGNCFGTGGALVHIVDFNTGAMARIQVRSRFYETTYGQDSAYGVRYIASANHYISQFNPEPDFKYESSLKRYERLVELIEQTERFDREACWKVLSDTAGGEENNNTISRVGTSSSTIFGLVITEDGFQYTMGPPSLYIKKFGEPPKVSYAELAQNPLLSFTARPLSRNVVLAWQMDDGIEAAGFKLYRAEDQRGEYRLVAELHAGVWTFQDRGLRNGKRYYYLLETLSTHDMPFVRGPVCATPRFCYKWR